MQNNISKKKLSVLTEVKDEFFILFPNILFQCVNSFSGYGVAIVVASIGIANTAAYSLIHTFIMAITILVYGVLNSVSIFLSHNLGTNDHTSTQKILSTNFYLVIGLSLLTIGLYLVYPYTLRAFSQSSAVQDAVRHYFKVFIYSVYPGFLSIYLFQILLSEEKTKYSFYTNIVKFCLLLFFAVIFTRGFWKLPPLGIKGVAWAHVLVNWLALPLLIYYVSLSKQSIAFKDLFTHFDKKTLILSLKVGVPIGLTLVIEILLNVVNAIFSGKLGVTQQALYTIFVQSFVAIIVFPFAVSQSIAVRTSFFMAGKQRRLLLKSVWTNIFISASILTVLCVLFLINEKTLYQFFFANYMALSNNIKSDLHTITLIMILLLFIETLRLVIIGALRGLQDVNFSLIVNVFSFLFIGVYCSYFLAFDAHFGVRGLVYGEAIATLTATVVLVFRWMYISENHM